MRPLLLVAIFIGLGLGAPPVIENYVVNGSDALAAEFPYMVSLRTRSGTHTCGATIIANSWLLTAAHCFVSRNPDDYTIQYGTNVISKDGDSVMRIRRIICHDGYDDNNQFIHDIALIELEQPLEFDAFVDSVRLPSAFVFTQGGQEAQLVGWGLNATVGGVIQTHLQKVDLETMTDDECRKLHFDKIHTTNICAGVKGGGKGQCTGDSGGPLLLNGIQVGIVSWSVKPCTIAPYPGVFTEVSHYIDWIRLHSGLTLMEGK
ncbi:chymotrypsin-2-like [Lutzomyia longipalpis]|uniref:chymotrypsin-2-like n=1 Tax=Lutzomyia longipalpis TaxID=7200 RepID=UPI0024844060|nr:chymotrypsin-2-like [Lutzomyia longipalpis]